MHFIYFCVNKSFFILFILPLVFTYSCQEKIQWPTKDSERRLIVEGMLTDELKKHQVKLVLSGSYFDETFPRPVLDAQVTITNGTSSFLLKQHPSNNGIYETIEAVKGEPGKSYILDIQLKNKIFDQTTYTASATMARPFPLDSIHCQTKVSEEGKTNQNNLAIIFMHGKEPVGKGDNYMLKLFKNSIPVTDTINKLIFINDRSWAIDGLSGIISWYRFNKKTNVLYDTLTTEIYAIQPEYEKYINSIDESSIEPDPFGMSGPPANIKGNISGKALGYFLVASVRRQTTIISPFEAEEAEGLKKIIEVKY